MSAGYGYIACFIAIFCYGSNFLPVKKVDIGDGVVFQFIMCNAIFMVSLPVYAVQGFPPFHSLAIFGGALWCTGNMLCGPAINLIGLGMGLLIWGSLNMLMGWATGTFGLFGLDKDEIKHPELNYVGITLAFIGLLVFLQVKPNEMKTYDRLPKDGIGSDFDHLEVQIPLMSDKEEREEKSPTQKRLLGVFMACCAGILFGTTFNPAQWVIDNRHDGEDNSLDYVFPQFCGILIASWTYTMIYFIIKQIKDEEPFVNPKCVLPATLSGLLWGVATVAWFYANGQLGFSVAFPVITSGPGFLGNLYGIFLFNEISGTKNYALLAGAFFITLPGLLCISLSH